MRVQIDLAADNEVMRAKLTTLTEVGVLVRTGRLPVEALQGALLAVDNMNDAWWLRSANQLTLSELAPQLVSIYKSFEEDNYHDSRRTRHTNS